MSRLPSEATKLRTAKADIRRMEVLLNRQAAELSSYRARATKAEAEVKEWKERFDLLLRLKPTPPATQPKEQP